MSKLWLDRSLVGLGVLLYLTLMTGNYFLPFASPYLLFFIITSLIIVATARFCIIYQPNFARLKQILQVWWLLLIVILAIVVGGILRYRAIQPIATNSLASEAILVIRQSNWQPKSYLQPPLYLYVSAGLAELQFLQAASAGKIDSPDRLNATDLAQALPYVNLIFGILTVGMVYTAATRLWNTKWAGMVAAILVATSSLSNAATNHIGPQVLGSLLVTIGFYSITRANFRWAGFTIGVATACVYSSALLLIPLVLAVLWQKPDGKFRNLGWAFLAWLGGLTIVMPGWILSFQNFVAGLTAIGSAPAQASGFYLKAGLANEPILIVVLVVSFVLMVAGVEVRGLVLSLVFPVGYIITLSLFGPLQAERLVSIVPAVAIAGGGVVATSLKLWAKKEQNENVAAS